MNAGDPLWFDELQRMTLDSEDEHAGFREVRCAITRVLFAMRC